jgi:hypothetical protein
MSKYQITLSGMKTIADYDPEEGETGNSRIVDTWEVTVASDSVPSRDSGRRLLNDFTFDRYGVGAKDLRYWPNEPGRFSTNRLEDEDGNEDLNGRFIADYDIRMTVVRTSPEIVLRDHFGLKSIDE